MIEAGEAKLLRIFVGETEKHHGKSLHEWIVERARSCGLAGATVLKGVLGYGAHSLLHSAKILRLGEDLPIIVEIVDRPDKIESFLPELAAFTERILLTAERVEVLRLETPPQAEKT